MQLGRCWRCATCSFVHPRLYGGLARRLYGGLARCASRPTIVGVSGATVSPPRTRRTGSRRQESQMMPMLPTARLASVLARNAIAVALGLAALLPGLAYADNPPPPDVPPSIRVPDGNIPFLLGHATGT